MSAQNIANMATIGYKRRVGFSKLIDPMLPVGDPDASVGSATDFTAGKPIGTDNPLDLAITGPGYFTVLGPDGALYTRQGQFKRDADGRLVTQQGLAVQAQGGGDIIIKAQTFTVSPDGTVLENGQPLAKLAVVDFTNTKQVSRTETGLFTAPDAAIKDVESPSVRQGALEASNVSTGDEMIAVMEALRRAETAQRLINVYDDLLGRAFSVLGQS